MRVLILGTILDVASCCCHCHFVVIQSASCLKYPLLLDYFVQLSSDHYLLHWHKHNTVERNQAMVDK